MSINTDCLFYRQLASAGVFLGSIATVALVNVEAGSDAAFATAIATARIATMLTSQLFTAVGLVETRISFLAVELTGSALFSALSALAAAHLLGIPAVSAETLSLFTFCVFPSLVDTGMTLYYATLGGGVTDTWHFPLAWRRR